MATMFGDTNSFSNSPWLLDKPGRSDDVFINNIPPAYQPSDVDLLSLETELNRVKMEQDMQYLSCTLTAAVTREASVTSSESSEDNSFDLDPVLCSVTEESFPFIDFPQESTVSDITFEWADTESNELFDDLIMHSPAGSLVGVPTMSALQKNNDTIDRLCGFTNWTSLSKQEQLHGVRDLTHIVSNYMGLREQLDIIRILRPDEDVLLTDTEFLIDLQHLNDDKLHKVQHILRSQLLSDTTSKNSSGASDTSSECSSPVQKKLSKRQRRAQLREARQRQKKEYRQLMKEKRSGLFHIEEVVSICNTDPLLGDEVDVLG